MAGTDFRLNRTLALPLVADPAPNTTPPDPEDLLALATEPPGVQLSNPNGLGFYAEGFLAGAPVSPGTFTWALWVRDEATKRFVGPIATGAAVADRVLNTAKVPPGSNCFVQVTATGGFAGADALVVRAVEMFL